MASLDPTEIKRVKVHPVKCPRCKVTVVIKPDDKVFSVCGGSLPKSTERWHEWISCAWANPRGEWTKRYNSHFHGDTVSSGLSILHWYSSRLSLLSHPRTTDPLLAEIFETMVNGGHQKDVIWWWRSFSAEVSISCYSEFFPHSTENREICGISSVRPPHYGDMRKKFCLLIARPHGR